MSEDTVEYYLPHRAPMVLVDGMNNMDDEGGVGELLVVSGLALMEGDYLGEGGLIEHMAQSAALYSGHAYRSRGEEVPVGFITKVSEVDIVRLPKVGETLSTRITIIHDMGYVTLIKASSFIGKNCISSCKLQVFIQQQQEMNA